MEGFGDKEEGGGAFARSAGSRRSRGTFVGLIEVGEDLGEYVEGELRDGHRSRWRMEGREGSREGRKGSGARRRLR